MIDNSISKERFEKIQKIRELGINPYPGRFERTHYYSPNY